MPRVPPGRRLLVALPALTVAVVALSWFGAGAERVIRGARAYGGPTVGTPRQSFRLELVESFKGVERALERAPIRVLERSRVGNEAAFNGTSGDDGVVEVVLPSLDPELDLTLTQGEQEFGRARVRLESSTWAALGTRRGGFQGTRAPAPARLLLAPARGVLAVPFEEEVFVLVERASGPVEGTHVSFVGEGGRVEPREIVVDAEGRGRVRVTPTEHSFTITARAAFQDGSEVKASIGPPLVPGAFDAKLDAGRLVVRSPVPRDRAYYSIVASSYRVSGGSVTLLPDGSGSAKGEIALGDLPKEPLWAVVSSARDLESPGRVGYPILFDSAQPAHTFDVPDVLWFDTLPQAARREAIRRSRVRWVTAGLCLVALLLEVALLLRSAKQSEAELSRVLAEAEMKDQAVKRRSVSAWLPALLALSLGFLILVLFSLYADH